MLQRSSVSLALEGCSSLTPPVLLCACGLLQLLVAAAAAPASERAGLADKARSWSRHAEAYHMQRHTWHGTQRHVKGNRGACEEKQGDGSVSAMPH